MNVGIHGVLYRCVGYEDLNPSALCQAYGLYIICKIEEGADADSRFIPRMPALPNSPRLSKILHTSNFTVRRPREEPRHLRRRGVQGGNDIALSLSLSRSLSVTLPAQSYTKVQRGSTHSDCPRLSALLSYLRDPLSRSRL